MQRNTAVAAVSVALLALAFAGPSLATPFTLAQDVEFNGSGASGFIRAVTPGDFGSLPISTDTQCLAGSCDLTGGSQDFVVFSIELTSGGIEALNVSNIPAFPAPAGFGVDGAGFIGAAAGEPAVSIPVATQARYEWTDLTGTSQVLFLSHDLGEIPTANGISFAVDPTVGVGLPSVLGDLVVVPEPTTAALLGLGLIGLGGVRRAGRR